MDITITTVQNDSYRLETKEHLLFVYRKDRLVCKYNAATDNMLQSNFLNYEDLAQSLMHINLYLIANK